MAKRRIAIVHDWLTGMRGGEKVLEILCDLFPNADIHTLIHRPGLVSKAIEKHPIKTSPLQYFPGIGRYYRHLLPLMPWAIEQLSLKGYDGIISTSHCVAKGAIASPGVPHFSYCHTPMRYIWDQYDQYFGKGRAGWIVQTAMKAVRPRLQRWDLDTLPRVTQFLANSENVRERIKRLYARDSIVIYPPVDTDFYGALPLKNASDKGNYYLIVSALAPYKRIDLAIEACKALKKKLVIIGEGQNRESLQKQVDNNIEFRGWMSNEDLREAYANAKALLFPGEEDFGIVPLEAMSAGCPVIAFGRGGALETVISGQTGLFFKELSVDSLINAIQHFEKEDWAPSAARQHAEKFSRPACKVAFQRALADLKPENEIPLTLPSHPSLGLPPLH